MLTFNISSRSSRKEKHSSTTLRFLLPFFLPLLLTSCIQDDIILDEVEPELRLTQTVDTLGLDDSFQFEASFFNNVGQLEAVSINWRSLDTDIVAITTDGLATGIQEGTTTITASYTTADGEWISSVEVAVAGETVIVIQSRTGTIRTTSSYLLEGGFEITATDDGVDIQIAEDYRASTALPGLYVYLTNNPNTLANALEIGKVTTFNGSHQYTVSGVNLNDYNYLLYFCKPFNVKVGDGAIE